MRRSKEAVVLLVLLVTLVLVGLCSASLMDVDWESLIVIEATETPNLWPVWDGHQAPSSN